MNNNKFIPLSVPNLAGNEIQYVTEALKDGWVSSAGPYVEKFEQKVAQYVNSKGAVSCQNGTSGIHTALMTLGVQPGDIVIVPALTFIATVNPVKYVGATPIFMDCDDSLCMDPVKLKSYLDNECTMQGDKTIDNKTGKEVKAVIVVHIFGNMADMESLVEIAGKYHIKILEDATEAIGTYYTSGKYTGKYAGTIGDMGVYSFNGNK
ncbi:MAG: aminotransferase class I/II-fold pyridoxal phosphate-dependent enzyme, partial [Clostridiales bacterium]|nr:aminotransferase class I/II-fold pyridoxal phosphate-dependent enzyme [Clostridiales bacterium]